MDLDRFSWLAGRVEQAIDPQRRIVDAHHHLWQRGGSTYLAAELNADATATHNVVTTVFVECNSKYDRKADVTLAPVGETRFVAAQADALDALSAPGGPGGPVLGGIVSHADMMLGPAVEQVLAAHEDAGKGHFRGIRHATSWDASDKIGPGHSRPFESMMATPQFRAGCAKLGEMGHSFDAWIFHPQLGELDALAKALPGLPIVLNHLGGPLGLGPYRKNRAEAHQVWQAGMRAVASNNNVVLKAGGIGMDHYFGLGWAELDRPPSSAEVAERWSDDVRWCIDLFGPQRCMFESNFPVDRQTLPYAVLWNALQIIAEPYSDTEQDQMFAGTAERIYRLH